MKRIPFAPWLLWTLAGLAAAGLLWLLWPADSGRPLPPPAEPVATSAELAGQEVTLYFGDPQEPLLVPEIRQIPVCAAEAECLQAVLLAWLEGPATPLAAVVPPGVRLLSARIEEGTTWVDLSAELVRRHPGGSQAELMTVTALANTLAVNFPHVRQVRLLIAGAEPATLKGHLLLGQPIPADFRFTRAPLGEGGALPREAGRE